MRIPQACDHMDVGTPNRVGNTIGAACDPHGRGEHPWCREHHGVRQDRERTAQCPIFIPVPSPSREKARMTVLRRLKRHLMSETLTRRSACDLSLEGRGGRRDSELRKVGAPDRIRTCDLRLRKPSLYPTELRAHRSENQIGRRAGDKIGSRSSGRRPRTSDLLLEGGSIIAPLPGLPKLRGLSLPDPPLYLRALAPLLILEPM